MAIQFECRCGKPFSVPDSMGGAKARCKDCGEVFTIPSAVMGPEGLEPLDEEPAPAPPLRRAAPAVPILARPAAPADDLFDSDLPDSSPLGPPVRARGWGRSSAGDDDDDEPRPKPRKKRKTWKLPESLVQNVILGVLGLAVLGVAAWFAVPFLGPDTIEKVAEDMLSASEYMTDYLESVKDEASAQAAAEKIARLEPRYRALGVRLAKLGMDQGHVLRAWEQNKHFESRAKAYQARMMALQLSANPGVGRVLAPALAKTVSALTEEVVKGRAAEATRQKAAP